MNDFLGGDAPQRSGRRAINNVGERAGRPQQTQQPRGTAPYEPMPIRRTPSGNPSGYPQRNTRNDYRGNSGNVPPSGSGRPSGPERPRGKKQMAGWKLVAIDVVITGLFLIVFSIFHHVLPSKPQMEPVALPQASAAVETAQPQQTEAETVEAKTVSETPQPTEEAIPFADKFTNEVVHTDTHYSDSNVCVDVSSVTTEKGVTYHVADIYLTDVSYLMSCFPKDEYGERGWVQEICKEKNAFVAINGDQGPDHQTGVIVRNGILYRESTFKDVAVLDYDGYLHTYSEYEFDLDSMVLENGAWQVWSFGPLLLTDGQPMEVFNTDVSTANPRTAIGMVEPLHYMFVVVDGRGESPGMNMEDLSQLMFDLGCTTAYNLDGGGTSRMAVNGEVYNTPSKDRTATDVIYIPMS